MKLIIDIPEEHYRTLQDAMKNHMESLIGKIILNGTPIPDNATNSGVMLTIFPDETDLHTFARHNKVAWWNAPYAERREGN